MYANLNGSLVPVDVPNPRGMVDGISLRDDPSSASMHHASKGATHLLGLDVQLIFTVAERRLSETVTYEVTRNLR